LTIRIVAKTSAQKRNRILRGGRVIVLGSGGFTEQPIASGGLAVYTVPIGKTAQVRGSLVWTVLGTQTFIEVTVFDTVSGRTIPIARANAVGDAIRFEAELFRISTPAQMTMSIRGSNAPNDATAEWIAEIQELPA